MGNPEFARYHLERILAEEFHVVAVVSAADKPGGRGMKIQSTPVTSYAKSKKIPCLQPKNLKNTDFQRKLQSYNADIQVVIAFRMLPEAVWNMPPLGTINLHASLLPQYRGAAPINWAIINGERKSGVTTFRLKHEIDTGGILLQKECLIDSNETAGSLHDKLMILGANTMIETLHKISDQSIEEKPQNENKGLKNAPKLFTHNTQINWDMHGKKILNFIKGLYPHPIAHTLLNGKKIQVYRARFSSQNHNQSSGIFFSDQKKYLAVSVPNGFIYLDEIKLQDKRKMKVSDFLNGYSVYGLEPIK
jgi:methionyl-tRNA formyltransferase